MIIPKLSLQWPAHKIMKIIVMHLLQRSEFTAIHSIYQQVLKKFRKLQGLSQMQSAYMIAIGKCYTKRI